MLVTITITLTIFSIYHLYLIKLNLTTNEKSKRGKMISYMKLIMDTLTCLSKEKGIDISNYNKIQLTNEDIIRFKTIAFKSKKIILLIL